MADNFKPNWDDAPDWANYRAIDLDGTAYWFQLEPQQHHCGQWVEYAGLVGVDKRYPDYYEDWTRSFEKRSVGKFEPDWSKAPEWANYWATDQDGSSYWYEDNPVIRYEHEQWRVDSGKYIYDKFVEQDVWHDILYKRPINNIVEATLNKPVDKIDVNGLFDDLKESLEETVQIEKGEREPSRMTTLYPKYYKDVSHLDSVDVYAVHNLFDVQDPSGAIQHASKKLLLSGVRTGGKSKFDDIREARDTLNRWIEINKEN